MPTASGSAGARGSAGPASGGLAAGQRFEQARRPASGGVLRRDQVEQLSRRPSSSARLQLDQLAGGGDAFGVLAESFVDAGQQRLDAPRRRTSRSSLLPQRRRQLEQGCRLPADGSFGSSCARASVGLRRRVSRLCFAASPCARPATTASATVGSAFGQRRAARRRPSRPGRRGRSARPRCRRRRARLRQRLLDAGDALRGTAAVVGRGGAGGGVGNPAVRQCSPDRVSAATTASPASSLAGMSARASRAARRTCGVGVLQQAARRGSPRPTRRCAAAPARRCGARRPSGASAPRRRRRSPSASSRRARPGRAASTGHESRRRSGRSHRRLDPRPARSGPAPRPSCRARPAAAGRAPPEHDCRSSASRPAFPASRRPA